MKALLAGALSLFITFGASAQFNFGISSSNWCTTNAMFINPASIAGCKERRMVSLFNMTTGVDNNVGPFNTRGGLVVAVGNGKANNMFRYTNNSRVSMLAPYTDITGPGVMWRLDSLSSFAVSTRLRGMNQFNNFDQTLFHTFNDPSFRTPNDVVATPKDFTYTVNLWTEIGATYSRVLYKDKQHKLKAGATLRYLLGIAYVGVKGHSMDIKFDKGNDTFFAGNTDIEYASNVLNTRSNQGNDITKGFFSLLYKGKFGHGVGGDVGVVYEYTPEGTRKRDGYKVRLSASVCDIGAITYGAGISYSERFGGGGNVTGPGILANVKNMENLKKYAVKRGFTASITQQATTVHMPTRLMLGTDYHLLRYYYVNVAFLLNLANREQFGNSYYNQFTITPRYETKKVTFGVPLTYSTLSNRFKMGIGVMSGGVFIGSDDMLSLLFKSEYGLNFYMGLNVPMYK